MTTPEPDTSVSELASRSLAADDPTGWFEKLYAAADQGRAEVPWDHREPHRLLVEWVERWRPDLSGKRALVVGSGLGDDAEYVAAQGAATVAFDVSPTAVAGARRRFGDSHVEYHVADLFDPPPAWREGFDVVVESYTVQALPRSLRERAVRQVAGFVAPGGTLLVVTAVLDADRDPQTGPPWPLTREELDGFTAHGLVAHRIEAATVDGYHFPSHWLAEFRRPVPA